MYAKPTVEGRSHATKHHYVAERFFGRSKNQEGEKRIRIFKDEEWVLPERMTELCYECHEVLLHNPVFLPKDVEAFARLVKARGFDEAVKPKGRQKIAGRIRLLRDVVAEGLKALLDKEG